MYVDVWNVIAKQERELNSIEKLRKLRLITPSTKVAFFMAYYRVSNSVLKTFLKTKVRSQVHLKRTVKVSKKTSAPLDVNPPRPTHPSYHTLLSFQR